MFLFLLVWFVYLWQQFNLVIWLVNLNKRIMSAQEGSVCCYRKGDRTVSSKEVECIDSYLIEGYIVEDPDFPNALCTDCHIELNKKINNNGYHLVPKVDGYDPGRSKYLRSSLECKCRICTVAKMTGLGCQWMVKKKKGRPAAAEKTTPKWFKVCSNCFQQIYQGSKTKFHKLKN